ncbi:hypothetical protein WH43_15150 [Rheinheimera sp. KL1]|uniref:hypothetical protein n=1 Tax=Rheinheimera sp. KL1 TaxID=1635005 RepID=UPI0006A959AC|nr:hypothetical protein [Rheinheimera sp. KL1]KOO57392.1 hypothetical protein WH43_15150 [Rheinheimera sp. KL1]
MNQPYPSLKVFLGFAICPFLAGSFLFLISDFYSFFSSGNPTLIHKSGIGGVFIYLAFGLYGILFWGIPAFVLAGLYVHLKLLASYRVYFMVFLLGGCLAHFWTYLLALVIFKREFASETIFELSSYKHFMFFALGSCSSVLMAYVVLPKETIVKKEAQTEEEPR